MADVMSNLNGKYAEFSISLGHAHQCTKMSTNCYQYEKHSFDNFQPLGFCLFHFYNLLPVIFASMPVKSVPTHLTVKFG